jgi:pimeloyl-ACP methyl ester carboxylesterase
VKTIYKTPESRAVLLAAYDRRLAQVDIELDSRTVETRFGPTHVLVAGPVDGPPLVLLHGANGNALELAEPMASFSDRHRCFFVDMLGEPNRSCEVRPSKSDDAYGRWMEDVLGALRLERVAMLGMSKGGFVALKCAAVIPERLSRVVLMVPEGLARPHLLPFLRAVAWPLARYRLSPTQANARRFIAALFTPGTEIPDLMVEQLSLVLKHVETDTRRGSLFSADDLAGLEAPVLVVAGGRDVIHPGKRVARHARAVIPNLRDVILVPEAGHIHFEAPGGPVMTRVAEFLAEEEAAPVSAR